MSDDSTVEIRRLANEAIAEFISDPLKVKNDRKTNPFLICAGAVSLIFPQIVIDWNHVEAIAKAVDKALADEN